jgi:hypothetical protein
MNRNLRSLQSGTYLAVFFLFDGAVSFKQTLLRDSIFHDHKLQLATFGKGEQANSSHP